MHNKLALVLSQQQLVLALVQGPGVGRLQQQQASISVGPVTAVNLKKGMKM
jgi:hypothetical protein